MRLAWLNNCCNKYNMENKTIPVLYPEPYMQKIYENMPFGYEDIIFW